MPRWVALVGLVFACSLTTLAPAALAQTTLISNITYEATVGRRISESRPTAQRFSTGGNLAGYTLSSVSFHITSLHSDASVEVKIYSDSNNIPDSEVYSLTNPTTVSTGLNTFTAPSGSTLAAGTYYFVHISAPAGEFGVSAEESGREESEKAEGWSIDNVSRGLTNNGEECLSIPSYFHKMANILLYSLCSASMAANSSSNGRNRSGGQLGICS